MNVNPLLAYATTLLTFVIADAIWLGLVAKKFYADNLGHLLTKNVNWGAAGLFYASFIAFLVYFVVAPALKEGSIKVAIIRGVLFGLATYATYDLTNYATLKGFPLNVVVVDLLWGATISALASCGGFFLYKLIAS